MKEPTLLSSLKPLNGSVFGIAGTLILALFQSLSLLAFSLLVEFDLDTSGEKLEAVAVEGTGGIGSLSNESDLEAEIVGTDVGTGGGTTLP